MAYEITIAKKGNFIDRLGRPYAIGDADIEEIRNSYDPAHYRAPLIFRHDNRGLSDVELSQSPWAFGFPQKLKRVGDELKAVFQKISPEAKRWIANGNAIALSPSFYERNSKDNPTPGKKGLRHIALLGAEPPAITGMPLELSPAELAAFEEAEDCFSFSAAVQVKTNAIELSMSETTIAQLLQNLREFLLIENGAEVADRVLPSALISQVLDDREDQMEAQQITVLQQQVYALQDKLDQLMKDECEEEQPSFSQGGGMGEGTEEARNPREIELEQELAKARELIEQNRRQGVRDFVKAQCDRGALLPGESDGIAEILITLDQAQPIELSAPDGTKRKAPQAQILRGLIERMEPAIHYGEIATGTGEELSDAYEFQQAPGYEISPQDKELYRKATAYQRNHPGTDLIAAYKAVGGK